jgi:hypothetical protein
MVNTSALSSPPSCATMRTMTSARLCIVPALQVSYLPPVLFITARNNTERPIDDSSLGPRFSNNSSAVVTSAFGAVAPLYVRSRRRTKITANLRCVSRHSLNPRLVPLNSEFTVLCAAHFCPGSPSTASSLGYGRPSPVLPVRRIKPRSTKFVLPPSTEYLHHSHLRSLTLTE